jgi:hypothetical protein
MKITSILPVLLLSCQQPMTEPPPEAPTRSKVCVTSDPADALIKVQGARVAHNNCIDTFPGEVAIEASAPGYKPFQTLLLVEGHASTQHIKLVKAAPPSQPNTTPTSTTQPNP